MTSRLEVALKYASRGWHVLPLHWPQDEKCSCGNPGCGNNSAKHPLTKNGLNDATTDPKIIREWLAKWPEANIGIRTGAISGFVVLDIDPRHAGDESLIKLETKHGKLPDTIESLTGGGGRHIFFQHPGGDFPNRARAFGLAGIDIRGDGGYIVAPPSKHISGKTYEWEVSSHPDDILLAELPKWLLNFPKDRTQKNQTGDKEPLIHEGQRNDFLTSLAGTMRRRAMPEEAIIAALLEVNRLSCKPPLTEEEVGKIAASISKYSPGEDAFNNSEKSEGKRQQEKQAQLIVNGASEAELFHTPEGEAFASFPVDGHTETHKIRSKNFKLWIQLIFFNRNKKPPGSQALEEAIALLEAKAKFESLEHEVFNRVAATNIAIYLDLGNRAWEVVEITSHGWRVLPKAPVKFTRKKGTLPLPHPQSDGDFKDLRQFVNVGDDDSWILFVSWLVAAMRPHGPYPILIVSGPQDSAKSTTTRLIKALIDPFKAGVRSTPRSEHDLMISATNSWCIALDNLSGISPWLSDSLCRLSTGGGLATRELYTDTDEVLLDAMRPIVLNGIGQLGTRQDLIDRTVQLMLSPIADVQRVPEDEFWAKFEKIRPQILGVLCDAVSCALRNVSGVKLSKAPRMADFAKWVVAAEKTLPWETGNFLKAYERNRQEAMELALEGDAVAEAVKQLMESNTEWKGTATEIFDALKDIVAEEVQKDRYWPKAPNSLGTRLRRISKALLSIGIEVTFAKGSGSKSQRLILIRRVPQRTDATDAAATSKSNSGQGSGNNDGCDSIFQGFSTKREPGDDDLDEHGEKIPF